jgi:gliding motility-associated-like protein
VSPGGGNYSLKLGNDNTGAQAERARYYVHVPANVNNYSLIYRYAVVFQNPSHNPSEQPRFEVKAYDSATNALLPCAQYTYVSSSSLPGFTLASGGGQVWYKSWTTASLDLSGLAGQTVAIDFASGDCDLGGHFGYGYVDMSCGLFAILNVNCNGSPTTTLNAPPGFQSYQWTDATYTTTLGTNQNVTINTPATGTQYHVILTPYFGFGCPDTLTTTVSIASLTLNPTNDTVVCSAGGLQLTAGAQGTSPYLYSWTPSAGLSCTNCANPTANPTAGTTYYVTVTDANGCLKTDSVHLSTGPVLAVNAQPVSCFGLGNGSATATASGGAAPYSYSWNTTPVQITSTISNLAPGSYVVTATDNVGCSKTATATITQPAGPIAASISNPVQVNCFGGTNGQATVTVLNGTAPFSYSWNTPIPQTTASVTNLAAGTYIATVTDSKGCTDTATVTITQPPLFSVAATNTNVNCFGAGTGTASAVASGGTPPYSFSWNTIPAQNSTNVTNLAAGNYTVTVTDLKGCTTTALAAVTQPAAPLAMSLNVSDKTCIANSTGAASTLVSGGTTPYTYSWNTTPVQSTAAATNLQAGTYTVTLTDSKGCTTTATAAITNPPPISIAVSNTAHVKCNGEATGVANTVTSGGTAPFNYTWNTTPVQTAANTSTLPAGSYIVTVADARLCTATASVQINQPPPVIVNMQTTKTCPGVPKGKAVATVSGGVGPYSLSWNTIPVQTGLSILNRLPGTYTLTVTDANGCVKTTPAVIEGYPEPNVDAGGDQQICRDAGIQLQATGAVNYAWSPTFGLSCTGCPNPYASPSGTTTYTIIGTDANGCEDTTDLMITVIQRVPVSVGGTKEICEGESTDLHAEGGASYSWSPASTLDDASKSDPKATPKETTKYQVIITENVCFTDTLHQEVKVYPMPTISLGEDKKAMPGAIVLLRPETSHASSIAWSPSSGLSCSDCFEPVATMQNTITYVATVTNEIGCTAKDDLTITVVCDGSSFYMPNTFTPNGDGENDRFYPMGYGVVAITRFTIYNRWGEIVFQSGKISANDPVVGWDGTFKNVPLKPDVFIYVAEATCKNGEVAVVRGDISLIR